eukprot:TRINITY_DN121913_c0_g1_i1.p1 TRINITY_DN121913_c0_g1~~TRINITY_DN121913_c0_g1_i1.p1  ORF type:complete len:431 (-),score=78.82 TRINITY_DN121913_c0_g1_i1:165-1388(-)
MAAQAAPHVPPERDENMDRLQEEIRQLQDCKAFWLDVLSDSAFREVVSQQLKQFVAVDRSFAQHVKKCVEMEHSFAAKQKGFLKGIGKGRSGKGRGIRSAVRKRGRSGAEDADDSSRPTLKRARGDDGKRLFTALPITLQADVADFLPLRDRLRMQTWSYSCLANVCSRPSAWAHIEIDKELCRKLLLQSQYTPYMDGVRELMSHAKHFSIELMMADEIENPEDSSDVEAFEEQLKRQTAVHNYYYPEKVFTALLDRIDFKQLQSLVVRSIEWQTLSFLAFNAPTDTMLKRFRWQEVSEDLAAVPGSCTFRASMEANLRTVDVQRVLAENASRVPAGEQAATSLTSKEAYVLAEFKNLMKVDGVDEFLRLDEFGFLREAAFGKAVHRYGARRLAVAAKEGAVPPPVP